MDRFRAEVHAIGTMHSDFSGKFGTPRQPGLSPSARGVVMLEPPYDRPEVLAGLEGYSHVWLLFWFHANRTREPRLSVRPPRLGGNRRLGVFATRSPYRPNPLGLSLLRLLGITRHGGRRALAVEGPDVIDATPVLDIKPYVPYADVATEVRVPADFRSAPEIRLQVTFLPVASAALDAHPDGMRLRRLLEEILALDPRPAYRSARQDGRHGMRIAGLEVRWRLEGRAVLVDVVRPAT